MQLPTTAMLSQATLQTQCDGRANSSMGLCHGTMAPGLARFTGTAYHFLRILRQRHPTRTHMVFTVLRFGFKPEGPHSIAWPSGRPSASLMLLPLALLPAGPAPLMQGWHPWPHAAVDRPRDPLALLCMLVCVTGPVLYASSTGMGDLTERVLLCECGPFFAHSMATNLDA